LLDIQTFDRLVTSLYNLDYDYSGVTFRPPVTQSMEDVKRDNPFIVVGHLPSSRKYMMSINNYLGPRENTNYSNYGYADVDKITVRVFARTTGNIDGRYLTQAWLRTIESYIKVNWNSLITGGSVDQYSFGHTVLPNMFTKRQYGYELMFDVLTLNSWTDEPAPGPDYKTLYNISGVSIVSGYKDEIRLE
jgi:hypothetical protein